VNIISRVQMPEAGATAMGDGKRPSGSGATHIPSSGRMGAPGSFLTF